MMDGSEQTAGGGFINALRMIEKYIFLNIGEEKNDESGVRRGER